MRYATEVAAVLREIHEQGGTHGQVIAANIAIRRQGAVLLPSRSAWDRGDSARDTREFGTLLFHMITGAPPRPGDPPASSRPPASRTSAAGLRASALQVAASCLAEAALQPTMQQVLTELRLLGVLLKMPEKGEPAALPMLAPPFATPRFAAPAPFLVQPTIAPVPIREAAGAAEPPLVPLAPASFGQPEAEEPAEISKRGGHCPQCDCSLVYVSRSRSRFERMLELLKLPICRCHRCQFRYVAFLRFKIGKEAPARAARKRRPHRDKH
jgi:hypothetical protein